MSNIILKGLKSSRLITRCYSFTALQRIVYNVLRIDFIRNIIQGSYNRHRLLADSSREIVQADHNRHELRNDLSRNIMQVPKED